MLRKNTIFLQFLVRQNVSLSRGTKTATNAQKSIDEEIPAVPLLKPNFLVRKLGSHYKKWADILEKHPELKTLHCNDALNSAEKLKALNFSTQHIQQKPMILFCNAITLENRYNVLRECGVDPITINLLAKYITVTNKSISLLKSFNYIPYDLNVAQKLINIFTDVEIELSTTFNESKSLRTFREDILRVYLRERLSANQKELEKIFKTYPHVRHKSFYAIHIVLKLLEDLNFSKERIVKNAYLIHGDAENMKRIVNEIKSIDNTDIREIVLRRPKLLMSNCDSLLKTLEHIKTFGISESAVLRCIEVLTLGPDTILERLRDLNEIEEFKVLASNPRILRLVHYQNKARMRLEFLNQLKVRCASLHILSCGSEAFAKFARDGSDKTKGCDTVVYLSNTMGKDENAVRTLISRHPNWCHSPALQIKQCYEMLLSKNFKVDDIFNNLHILLYPIKRIEEKLQEFQSHAFVKSLQLNVSPIELSGSQILTLILYLIESEFHFTGDGIWVDNQTHTVENFNNLLPDFPESSNKVYKYGMKPSSKASKVQALIQSF